MILNGTPNQAVEWRSVKGEGGLWVVKEVKDPCTSKLSRGLDF